MAVFDTRRAACESAGMTTARNTALIAVLVAGCGAAGQSAPAPLETARNGQQHEVHAAKRPAEGDEMVAMTPEVKAFHDVLAPRWHAERGAKRMADTCAAVLHRDRPAQHRDVHVFRRIDGVIRQPDEHQHDHHGQNDVKLSHKTSLLSKVAVVGCDKRDAVAPGARRGWCDCASLVTPYALQH